LQTVKPAAQMITDNQAGILLTPRLGKNAADMLNVAEIKIYQSITASAKDNPDGKEINGFTKQIGDGIYQKADGTSTVQIRYLPGYPYFSELERNVGMGAGSLVLIVAGGVLVFLLVYKLHIKHESENM
jgi:hypothetical protein